MPLFLDASDGYSFDGQDSAGAKAMLMLCAHADLQFLNP